jgi:hypothetical protein
MVVVLRKWLRNYLRNSTVDSAGSVYRIGEGGFQTMLNERERRRESGTLGGDDGRNCVTR